MFVNKYPYTDIHELNLDWLLGQMLQLRTDMKDFVNQNIIKYADPIQWDITTQYESNTVVIEPNSGNAYISSQPVPAGVAISNTDYWSVIGNFSVLYESIKESIAAADDGSNINATEARTEGQLLWLNSKLYKVLSDISVGALYITSGTGQNLQEVTVEELLHDIESKAIKYFDTVSDMISADLQEGELVKVKGYYTVNDQGAAFYTISTSSDGFSQVLDNGLYANILIEDIMCPEQFGAYGDGVHDDVLAFNEAVKYASNIIANNNYKFITPISSLVTQIFISIPSNRKISGTGTITLSANNYAGYVILGALAINETDVSNITIEGLTIIGDKDTHTGTTGQWGFGVGIFGAHDITVKNCKISKCWGDGIYIGRWETETLNPYNINITDNIISENRRNNMSVVSGEDVIISNNQIKKASGQSPQAGIDLEPDNELDLIKDVIISDNIFEDNTALGVQTIITSVVSSLLNVQDVTIDNNIFTGSTGTPVRIANNTTTYGSSYRISNNKFYRTYTGIEIRKVGCVINDNEFHRVGGVADHIIFCPNILSGEMEIIGNVFDNCRAAAAIMYIYDGYMYAANNTFITPVAPATIAFNENSIITCNLFSSYYNALELEVINYTGQTGILTATNNTVIRRGSVAPLRFLNCTNSVTAANATLANNVHVGQSFTNLTGFGGGNNYLNGVLVQ